ncbi:hypothetical protein [Azonexus sp. IMCC34839]|uniref:hypothetical protein n=1 Tax=Azonexus sp. IMCC34839 TaxID=3133695 RepID=UPI00399BA8BB
MLRKFVAVFAISTLLAIPVVAQQGGKYSAFVAKAKYQLTRDFKDPSSAQYRNAAVYKNSDGKISLCGEVNAKNSFGAYIGFVPFYADETSHTIKQEGDDVVFPMLYRLTCETKLSAVK